ncbi:GCN5-related N-acetyltransferase [Catenulispora acidiphila DSM 44928]|uniref:GCN5-related N-acetyltransferase n=1 Tax=Catenulispora acidiphila (strain DSM 44928 / JCM 14897 / NBRC 102108 / NRRL B-24433 / ID139908) TaxID=479433 RepID=C7Q1F3_CATAD|nr:GNAT family N-acetyltransferase [Catenulispora acidiphila]ACU73682.1 GCN5-related N-acetyltransferase [Catenulispora acidiphila DSM 44928]
METNPTVITADGLILREWTEDDVSVMHELFDDSEVAYWTPLESPFDEAAALRYLRSAQLAKRENKRLHLAITVDGRQALGEILLGLTTHSIGYAVGTAHRGQRLATRALRAVTEYAHSTLDWPEVVLEIEPDNAASVAVARAVGFQRSEAKPETVTDKGRTFDLFRWEHRRSANSSSSSSEASAAS